MAVTTLQRVIGFESRPLVLRQFETIFHELFTRVDGAEEMSPHLLGCLHLAGDLVGPVVRHVTVGAGGAHAGAVGVVDRDGNFRSEITPSRYFCVQCHIPQMDVKPPVENTFVDAEKAVATKKAAKK